MSEEFEDYDVCPKCGLPLSIPSYCPAHGDVSRFRGETLAVVEPENQETKEVEEAKENIEKARHQLWKREVASYIKEEELEEEELKKRKNKAFEKEFGKDIIAIVNRGNPYRRKGTRHKSEE